MGKAPCEHKFLRFICSEKLFNAIKEGTKNWLIECPKCGFKEDWWDAGGIRWKGAGEPRNYILCKGCGKGAWMKIRRKSETEKHDITAPRGEPEWLEKEIRPNRMRTILQLSLGLMLTIQMVYQISLPDHVVTNFDFGGNPNGWMSKGQQIWFLFILFALVNTLFLAVPGIMKKLPLKYINFPNKEYWFEEERKEKTISLISKYIYSLGFGTNLFIIVVAHLVFIANTSDPVQLDMMLFFSVILLYLTFVYVWSVHLFREFRTEKERG